jgi:hypothetical protein
MSKTLKLICFRIIPVQTPIIGTNPKKTKLILTDISDLVVTQAIGIIGIVFNIFKSITIIYIDSILCTKPHKTFGILNDGFNNTLRQAFIQRDADKRKGGLCSILRMG